MSAFGQARTIPASEKAKNIMKQLVTKGLFNEQRDVWQLGAALGISLGKKIIDGNRSTFQNVNSLDPDDIFSAIMLGLYPNLDGGDRLQALVDHAEWGIQELNDKEQIGTLDFVTLLET